MWRLLGVLALVVLLSPAVRAEVSNVALTDFSLERTDSGLLLSATLQLELPPVVEEALRKGIPVYFVAEADLLRDRWYWYDAKVASAARYMRLAYQPLTRRWRLNSAAEPIGPSNLGGGLTQHFDSLEGALAVLLRISRWKIAEPGDIQPSERHNVEFRFHLDVGQLPRLLQLGRASQADWHLALTHHARLPQGGR